MAKSKKTGAEDVIVNKGRKPKGGKVFLNESNTNENCNQVTNIILHLKCTMADLDLYNADFNKFVNSPTQYDPTIPLDFESFYNDKYSVYQKEDFDKSTDLNLLVKVDDLNSINVQDQHMIDIDTKLRSLKINLYKNSIERKSACFWCTYTFDNLCCFIPKYEIDGQIYGYGAFCCPECATAYLMKENIDDSTKFERYHLLNQIYAKVFDYKINIKPAPNPFYLLDKFYGNMSIHEYRKILKSDHILVVIDKPITRLLPELHDDNDSFQNFYGVNGIDNINSPLYDGDGKTKHLGKYKVKRQSDLQTGPSKCSIIREHFGLQS